MKLASKKPIINSDDLINASVQTLTFDFDEIVENCVRNDVLTKEGNTIGERADNCSKLLRWTTCLIGITTPNQNMNAMWIERIDLVISRLIKLRSMLIDEHNEVPEHKLNNNLL